MEWRRDSPWRRLAAELGGSSAPWCRPGRNVIEIDTADLPAAIALANDALPDDSPYKITREDMRELNYLVDTSSREWGADSNEATFFAHCTRSSPPYSRRSNTQCDSILICFARS